MTPSEMAQLLNELRVIRETVQAMFSALVELVEEDEDPFAGAVDVDSPGEE